MKKLNKIELFIFLINSAAFVAWIFWLVFFGHGVLFSQDGIVAFFPVVPVFFIYFIIFSEKKKEED